MKKDAFAIQSLPEYENNPFIARLPPPFSRRQIRDNLISHPLIQESEKSYPLHLRKHCIVRLFRYFEPLERQFQFAERIDILLRQGYLGRNPLTHSYIRQLQNGIKRIQSRSFEVPALLAVEMTGVSFALTGCSGNGKSKSIERILHQYPQTIQHTQPFSLIQIVWLKLDCPYLGSPKQLCINFFAAVDTIVGSNYLKLYGSKSNAVDDMMLHMAHIATLHAIGLLVIDEIQHLNQAKIGSEALLNFLVTLVNTIGIPVVLIGTLSAVRVLQRNFRQARRASGLGSLIWDRMPKGRAWDHFIGQLWKFQWTRETTTLSPELKDVLYEESQGILDIVVRLFILAQFRAIDIGSVRKIAENLTPDLFRKIAREDFRIVQPMLNALRANDFVALAKFDDLLPLQAHVENLINESLGSSAHLSDIRVEPRKITEPETVEKSDDQVDVIAIALRSFGISDDVVQILIKDAQVDCPSGDPLLLMAKISAVLTKDATRTKKTRRSKVSLEEQPIDDLRRCVASGKKLGQAAYETLLAAGIVKPPMLDFSD